MQRGGADPAPPRCISPRNPGGPTVAFRRSAHWSQWSSVRRALAVVTLHHDALVAVRGVDAQLAQGLDGLWPAVVDEQRELDVALVLADQRAEVAEADLQVRVAV